MRSLQVIRVEWDDIKQDPSWQSQEKAEESQPVLCITVGFLLKIDRKGKRLVVAHTHNDQGDSDHTVIPLGVIRRICNLVEGKDLPKSKWKV